MKRLLVIRLGALGDLLHLSPSLDSVRAALPDLEIHCLTSPAYVSLMRAFSAVDRVWTFDKRAGWPGLFGLAKNLRAAGIDGVVNLHPSLKTFVLAALLRVPQTVYRKQKLRKKGFLQRRMPRRHAANDFYEPFRRLLRLPAIAPDALIPQLEAGVFASADAVSPEAAAAMPPVEGDHRPDSDTRPPGERWIGIIPGVGGKRGNRAWLPRHYVQLIRALLEVSENRIFLIGGPDERELAHILASDAGYTVASDSSANIVGGQAKSRAARLENHCGRHDLAGTIRLLSRCNLVIGGDTGPMHVAAALGIPLVGVYGPTSRARTGPLGTQPMQMLTPPETLACWPCERPVCPLQGDNYLACMRDIAVEQVFDACQRLLRR